MVNIWKLSSRSRTIHYLPARHVVDLCVRSSDRLASSSREAASTRPTTAHRRRSRPRWQSRAILAKKVVRPQKLVPPKRATGAAVRQFQHQRRLKHLARLPPAHRPEMPPRLPRRPERLEAQFPDSIIPLIAMVWPAALAGNHSTSDPIATMDRSIL